MFSLNDFAQNPAYKVDHNSLKELTRSVAFDGVGAYSLDDEGVYRKGSFATYSRVFITKGAA
jgi:hypothetical protein